MKGYSEVSESDWRGGQISRVSSTKMWRV